MGRLRLFAAVLPPDPFRERLGGTLAEAGRRYKDVKWSRPNQLHLTLAFFGGQEEERLPEIRESLGRAAAGAQAFEAELGGAGAFPPGTRPRVLFLPAVKGREGFGKLAAAVSDGMEKIGIGPEEREYRPHLTLGRVREGADGLAALAYLEENLPPSLGSFPVDRVLLFQSRLAPEGPLYSRLGEFPLGRRD